MAHEIYAIYKSLPATRRNAHATAAMVKVWGLVWNFDKVMDFLSAFRTAKKGPANARFSFMVYQAALTAVLSVSSFVANLLPTQYATPSEIFFAHTRADLDCAPLLILVHPTLI